MHALVTRFSHLSFRQRLVGLMVLAMLALPLAAFAQATPEAYTSTTLLESAGDMLNTWNLWPFVIAFAVVGIVGLIIARVGRRLR